MVRPSSMRRKPPTLSPRLAAVASMVPVGSRVVDVGTDHGKLPVVLLANGQAEHVLAVDISAKALAGAAHRVESHGLAGRMEARLSDGLTAVRPGEVDVITICGMGGHRMRRILEAADLAGMFCNELLDQALRAKLSEETEPVRNLILAHALSHTSLTEDLESVEPGDDPLQDKDLIIIASHALFNFLQFLIRRTFVYCRY